MITLPSLYIWPTTSPWKGEPTGGFSGRAAYPQSLHGYSCLAASAFPLERTGRSQCHLVGSRIRSRLQRGLAFSRGRSAWGRTESTINVVRVCRWRISKLERMREAGLQGEEQVPLLAVGGAGCRGAVAGTSGDGNSRGRSGLNIGFTTIVLSGGGCDTP